MKPLQRGLAPLLWFCGACFGQASLLSDYADAVRQSKQMHDKGDLEGVIRTLTPWVEKVPDRAEAQHLLGLALYRKQNLAGAIQHLTMALKSESENSPAGKQTIETLAMAYYFSNRWKDALPLLETAAAWNAGDTYFLYALAMAHVYGENWEAATRTFARLFDLPPDSPQALLLTSHFAAREKFAEAAHKLILEAQTKRPDLPDINYRLGLIALANGALAEAARRLEKELAANPIHPMALHYLGDIHIRQGKLDEAVKSLQRAIWLNLRSTESYVLIASAYTQQGKHLEAEQALQRALELAPQNYEARFLLARVYHKTNRPELARKEMAIASKLRAESEARR